MGLRQYLLIGRKYWWLLLAGLLLGGVYGAYKDSNEVQKYRSGVVFFVRTSDVGSAGAANSGDLFAQRRVNSYLALLRTSRLADMLVAETGLPLTPGQMRSRISGSADINTVLLTARATDTSRERALQIADALATQFVQLVNEVESPDGGLPDDQVAISLEVVSGPSVTLIPTSTKMTIGTWGVLGLILAAAVVFVRELLDNAVRSADDLGQLSPAPLLGAINFDRRVKRAPLIIRDDALSIRAEAFRQLRTNLQFVDLDRPVQVVVVTSSVAGEGKSSISANLAVAMANSTRRVLIVEADLRRPFVSDLFNVERSVGLTDVLVGRVDLEDALQPWGPNGLVVLPCGTLPPNPSELLGSEAMKRLLTELRHQFDFIILDTPPLLPVTDAAVAATESDGVMVVVRFGKTPPGQVQRALGLLGRVDARVLGFVASMVPSRGADSYSYGAYQAKGPIAPSDAEALL